MVLLIHKEQRRDLIMVNFLRARGKMLLHEIKDAARQEQFLAGFVNMKDNALSEWLRSIDDIKSGLDENDQEVFFVRQPMPMPSRRRILSSSMNSNVSNKRKNPSPSSDMSSPPAKRSSALPVLLKAAEHETRKESAARRSTRRQFNFSRQCQPYKTDPPNLYGALLIGDDNFLNMALFDLHFEAKRVNGIRQSGGCVSGLRIADATRMVLNLDSDRFDHVIINVGSVDVAEGRPLIQLIRDYTELIEACKFKSLSPILTTLTPMPNYLYDHRRVNLIGFNVFIKNRYRDEFPVVDLYKDIMYTNGRVNWHNFQAEPRHIAGSKKAFVLWNKAGRVRMRTSLEHALGFAMIHGIDFSRDRF